MSTLNDFDIGMNGANLDFATVCHETFKILTGGTVGEATAISIDDMTAEQKLAPGGQIADNVVIIFISSDEMDRANLQEQAKLEVRGRRVRIQTIGISGDNAITLTCTGAGVAISV